LNWFPVAPGVTAAIARIAPFPGLIETTAAAGSFGLLRVCVIAFRAAFRRVDRVTAPRLSGHRVQPCLRGMAGPQQCN
jgi:hypothetical protein